jgi:hypothetical protein
LAIAAMVSIGIAVRYTTSDRRENRLPPIARLRHHCSETRSTLERDASQLRREYGGNPVQAAINLHLQLVHESPEDVRLCGGAPHDVDRLDACFAAADYPCLDRLATAATISMPAAISHSDAPGALARMRVHCDAVRDALQRDADDFEAVDPQARHRAETLFLSYRSLHSAHDIELCAPEVPDLSAIYACYPERDYPCLARLARLAEQSIYIP